MSNGLVAYFPYIAVVAFAAAWLFRNYYLTDSGKRVVDRTMLQLPILGDILRKIAVARFCRTLSTLISSGVPILDGLDITAKTSGNAIIEDAIMVTRKSIERGETISAPLKETNVFPAMVTQMIGVGEATGALDTMLAKIADFYEEEVDTAVAYVNASTQFTDGAQFGLGAEIIDSTQKTIARGPVGLREITTYKWIVLGDGQTRP